MNTIKIDNEFNSKIINIDSDTIIYYKDCDLRLDVIINKDIKLIEFIDNSSICNNYILNNNLIINRFSNNSSNNDKFNLNISDINLDYFYSCLNKDSNLCKIEIYHNKRNTSSRVISHGINLFDKKLEFLINGIILEDSINVSCNQDSKIIIMDENNCVIKPNLIVDNNEIEANHSAYIGKFNKDDLFYLMSRGISYDDSIKLLAKSFLLKDIDFGVEIKDRILNLINECWR